MHWRNEMSLFKAKIAQLICFLLIHFKLHKQTQELFRLHAHPLYYQAHSKQSNHSLMWLNIEPQIMSIQPVATTL